MENKLLLLYINLLYINFAKNTKNIENYEWF